MNEVVTVNEHDEVAGTMLRSEAHKNGTPHRIAVIYVENDKGEILVQIRMSGTLDHSSAGHVDPGESYLQTAQRELKEELGIENVELVSIGKDRSDERNQKDVKSEHVIHVFEVFLCKAQPKNLSEEEVKGVYWQPLCTTLLCIVLLEHRSLLHTQFTIHGRHSGICLLVYKYFGLLLLQQLLCLCLVWQEKRFQ